MLSQSGQRNPLEELAEEFLNRYRRGERPSPTEYAKAHPEWAEDILDLFPALVVMEAVVPGEAEAAGGGALTVDGHRLEQLGEYRIIREVGRGGMGVVYEAEQEALGRRVALKVLPPEGSGTSSRLLRFRREARSAARLHHTNIVPVFDVGVCQGVHYYTMQFIRGQALDQVLVELKRMRGVNALPPGKSGAALAIPEDKDRTQPFAGCLAGQLLSGHFSTGADQPGNVPPSQLNGQPDHRGDAAPSGNCRSTTTPATDPVGLGLVGNSQSDLWAQSDYHYYRSLARLALQVAEALAYAHGQKILHRDIKPANLLLDLQGSVWLTDFGLAKEEGSDLTRTGDVVGTLRFMAPERFNGQSDARGDIYSLGLTLYELLTLSPAFEDADRGRLIQRVLQQEPPRPCKADPRIPKDLETIVLKAIAKEPDHRYQTADGLAEDLRLFLADRPIQARRTRLPELVWRWCRRNPALAAQTAAVLLLLVVVAVGSFIAAAWWHHERDAAVLAESAAVKSERARREQLADAYLAQSRASRTSGRPGQRFESLAAVKKGAALARELDLPATYFDALRTEAIAALVLADLRVVKEWEGFPAGSFAVDFDDALRHFARTDGKGGSSLCRVSDNAVLAHLPGTGPNVEAWPSISPDGRFVLAWGPQCYFRVWKASAGQPVVLVDERPGMVQGYAFSLDSKRLAYTVFSAKHQELRLVDLEAGTTRRFPQATQSFSPAFHPDGRQLALATAVGGKQVIQVHDLATGKVSTTLEVPAQVNNNLVWHPNGRMLAGCCANAQVYCWDVVTGVRRAMAGSPHRGANLSFNHAGNLLAGGGSDAGIVSLWDPYSGRRVFQTKSNHLQLPKFSRDDRFLAGAVAGTRLQLLEIARSDAYRTLTRDVEMGPGDYFQPAITPDGRLLAVAMGDGLRLWDLDRGTEVAHVPQLSYFHGVLTDANEDLLTNGPCGLLRWPLRPEPTGDGRWTLGPPQALVAGHLVNFMARSGDGRFLASGRANNYNLLLDRRARPPRQFSLVQDDVRHLAISPDGRWTAAGTHVGTGHTVQIWDNHTGKPTKMLPVEGVGTVAFSPDGRWLATGGRGCQLWTVDGWREGPRIGGSRVFAFSRDSKLLAVETSAGVVRLVDPATGREYARLEDPSQDRADALLFSPDDTRLMVVTNDDHSSVNVWELRRIREQLQALQLDWELPPYPPLHQPRVTVPLRVTVNLGHLAPR